MTGLRVSAIIGVVLFLSGCAGGAPTLVSERESIAYREHPHLQRVWLADGVTFQAYDSVLVGEVQSQAVNVNPDGLENLTWARAVLREEIVAALRAKNAFRTVAVNEAEVPPGSRVVRFHNVIVEYEKGGGGARWFAGVFGAGQPVIRVRGRLTDGERLIFAYEARRSGDSGMARVGGGYRSDRAIQEVDIRDLAGDLADFIVRTGRP